MDRNQEPPNGENIDVNDISDDFDNSKSCVITALFYAEEAVKSIFGVNNVEQFHKALRQNFTSNKYHDNGGTDHQKNNLWKNYSDSNVYPSLYAYFGYKSLTDDEYRGKELGYVTDHNKLPMGKGILMITGHAIYFNRTGSGTELRDNENTTTDGVKSMNRGEASKIKEIYMK